MGIHPTAIIESGAQLHPSVQVGAYSIIERGAVIGPGCVIESCVRIYGATRMGRDNRIGHGATIGAEPQDLGYRPELSKPLTIGDCNHFKEGVNISRGIKTNQGTRIGDHNFLMAYAHIGHDCTVGDYNIFANTATLAGHAEVENQVFLSGQTAVHQFCRIGAVSMIAGVTGVPQDVPPFVIADGHRARIIGLNLVGLRRNGYTQAQRSTIKAVYRVIFRSGLRQAAALAKAERDYPSPQTRQIVRFIESSRRGVISFA
ncbi:acyl-ACP--UDP-N-acetylglucosamine O-acyltransferase [Candidatus Thiosymbion oneisti]|uniref:acyl-ACP--UDP-N-acetylglucosamine O-acyltransferase n=1 Tax=Candidatus Thiosymbion oneisti TaxID=589554 RepID=UPI00105F1D07|nr:acyl-ACP--UDP-N-acetylglucosamine O-acyltransferase [Candidatus Thiosymbion oneisti]